jgi:glycosyltransferase involved in cell wall biosynthesis
VAITLTEFARDLLLQGGLPPNRTVVKPNFVPDPGSRPNPPSHSHQVLFVGRLSAEKGIQLLLEAWAEESPQDLELVVIGSGPIGADLAASAPPGVRFLGQRSPSEVMSQMLKSRALILPSLLYEVQPMVALEALAAGLPIFHTNLGALGDTCGAGGLSLGLGSVGELMAGLRTLSAGDLLDGLGKGGRQEFETRFTEQKSLDALRGIYDLALGRDNPVIP